jgi:hypothetical protein
MCNVYIKLDPVQKLVWKFFEFEKKCDRTGTKEFKIWKEHGSNKPLLEEPSHNKFWIVKIASQVLSKRKNGTTLVFTSVGEELETIKNWNQHSSFWKFKFK